MRTERSTAIAAATATQRTASRPHRPSPFRSFDHRHRPIPVSVYVLLKGQPGIREHGRPGSLVGRRHIAAGGHQGQTARLGAGSE